MSRQIILDTETTGMHVSQGHRIIEIGCVEIINRKITNNHFHCYLNPQREVDPEALEVHGITNEFLQDKPLFNDIASELMNFLQGAELIIHNAPFDVSFINYELGLTKNQWKPLAQYCRIVDTLALARKLHAGMKNSLDALCKRYGVDNTKREYHGALLDAYLLTQVYLIMTEGQRSLFKETDMAVNVALPKVVAQINPLRQPIVIQANEQEITLHQEYLQKMEKQGKCLWATGRDG